MILNPIITRDGPEVRELLQPGTHTTAGVARQSLAETRVAPGTGTLVHGRAEPGKIYHIVSRRGRMEAGEREFPASAGDSVCIVPLGVLCACTAPCGHEDTELPEA